MLLLRKPSSGFIWKLMDPDLWISMNSRSESGRPTHCGSSWIGNCILPGHFCGQWKGRKWPQQLPKIKLRRQPNPLLTVKQNRKAASKLITWKLLGSSSWLRSSCNWARLSPSCRLARALLYTGAYRTQQQQQKSFFGAMWSTIKIFLRRSRMIMHLTLS
jgi:hypothetical protein